MRTLKLYTNNTTLDFGKHKGSTLEFVLKSDSEYLRWCIENVKWFIIDHDLIKSIIEPHYKIESIIASINESTQPSFEEIISKYYEINDSKYQKLNFTNNNSKETEYYYDQHEQWVNDMSENWLEYAAGTDDAETMNDVYWNLD
ncbi:MAG: hypothetical protein ACRC8Z_15185 [Empedobacter falsenii]